MTDFYTNGRGVPKFLRQKLPQINTPFYLWRTALSVLVFVCFQFVCLAQESRDNGALKASDSIKPLEIGDEIPEELWEAPLQVVNHPEGKEVVTLDEYRGKLIILDFWATWCIPCLNSFPKLEKLQDDFKEDIVIISLTEERRSLVHDFLKNSNKSMQTVVEDRYIKEYFPHRSIPHFIWIKDGRVLAAVGIESVNENNIERVLLGEDVEFVHRKQINFDRSKPLMVAGNGGDEINMLYQSVITGRIPEDISGEFSPNPTQFIYYNQTIDHLFFSALQRKGIKNLTFFNNRKYTLFEVDDSLKNRISPLRVLKTKDDLAMREWAERNTFCYNLVFPKESNLSRLDGRMFQDLNQFFSNYLNFECVYETRKVKALALIKTDSFEDISSEGRSSSIKWGAKHQSLSIVNSPIQMLVNRLSGKTYDLISKKSNLDQLPIVDETGIEGNVDLFLEGDFSDFDSIRSVLRSKGLDLVEKETLVKMIVYKYAN